MNRRSLLKTIGACLGFGLWSKTGEGKKVCSGPVEQTNPACWSEKENVCDPLPLPEGDFEKGIHNATFVRNIVPGLSWVRLVTGEMKVVENGCDGKGLSYCRPGQRLILGNRNGLWIMLRFYDHEKGK